MADVKATFVLIPFETPTGTKVQNKVKLEKVKKDFAKGAKLVRRDAKGKKIVDHKVMGEKPRKPKRT